jgi:ketosteroid isomerase-like protein
MNRRALWPPTGLILLAVLFVGTESDLAVPAASAGAAQAASCATPEYRQFDFWAGDWDAYDFGTTTIAAHVRVDRILGNCVLREDYQGVDGHRGQSFSIYDASRRVWHQTWVTSGGHLLMIDGQFRNREMVLTGADPAKAEPTLVRGIWQPVEGGVREIGVTSTDGGKTWKPWFDLMFRPARTSAQDDDRKTLAALDTAYQAAVKQNDAATMDRILADDFVLVTGSGKTYNKADLLEEARSGRVTYAHQEDTEQTVRVWGNTAVVTAKLWEQGVDGGKPLDRTVWFSDTYVRTPEGWRYVFGQSSLPLPSAQK